MMQQINKRVKLVKKKDVFFVYIDEKLFFYQKFLKSNDKGVSDCLYTYFYVLKIMSRFGLVSILDNNENKLK
jgi:hypothetical protein